MPHRILSCIRNQVYRSQPKPLAGVTYALPPIRQADAWKRRIGTMDIPPMPQRIAPAASRRRVPFTKKIQFASVPFFFPSFHFAVMRRKGEVPHYCHCPLERCFSGSSRACVGQQELDDAWHLTRKSQPPSLYTASALVRGPDRLPLLLPIRVAPSFPSSTA